MLKKYIFEEENKLFFFYRFFILVWDFFFDLNVGKLLILNEVKVWYFYYIKIRLNNIVVV